MVCYRTLAKLASPVWWQRCVICSTEANAWHASLCEAFGIDTACKLSLMPAPNKSPGRWRLSVRAASGAFERYVSMAEVARGLAGHWPFPQDLPLG